MANSYSTPNFLSQFHLLPGLAGIATGYIKEKYHQGKNKKKSLSIKHTSSEQLQFLLQLAFIYDLIVSPVMVKKHTIRGFFS